MSRRRKNRYSRLYVQLKLLAEREGWGASNFGRELAKSKVKLRFNIGSFRDLTEKGLKELESALDALLRQGWNSKVSFDRHLIMDNNDQRMPKVQITRNYRKGVDRFGKPVSETSQMFNIRCDSVDEALELYRELEKKFYAKPSSSKKN